MIDSQTITSTRPYLIRALHEWCVDNGFTPHLVVSVDASVQVPQEFVKDGEIVLNVGLDATSALKLGQDFIEFKGRFGGKARDIMVPVERVIAIYARENGQGMSFPLYAPHVEKLTPPTPTNLVSVPDRSKVEVSDVRNFQLTQVESERLADDSNNEPEPPRTSTSGPRPVLKRIK